MYSKNASRVTLLKGAACIAALLLAMLLCAIFTGRQVHAADPLPSTPKMLSAITTDTSIDVSWSEAFYATKYRIYRKINGGPWKKVKDTSHLTYKDTQVVEGNTYTYTARAFRIENGKVISGGYDKKGISAIYGKQPAPTTPELVSLTGTSKQAVLAWNASNYAQKYRIYRKVNKGGWKKVKDTSFLTYTDTAVSLGNTYTYTVRAFRVEKGKVISSGYNKKGLSITISDGRKEQFINVNPASAYLKAGESLQLSVEGAKTSLSYGSSNKAVATVNSRGIITDKAKGTAVITVRAKATSKYLSAYQKMTINVSPAPSLSEAQMKAMVANRGTIGIWAYTDYDRDGIKEAYAVTVRSSDDPTITGVYFVNQEGMLVQMNYGINAALYTDAEGFSSGITIYSGKSFFHADYGTYGSEYLTLLYSVKDGKPYELKLSGKIMGFIKQNEKMYTYGNDYSQGYHAYVKYILMYDSTNEEFVRGVRVS